MHGQYAEDFVNSSIVSRAGCAKLLDPSLKSTYFVTIADQ